ncbi:dTMP kinase [Alteromonas sp. ASW11-36]|uniref:Thymidylate kinase n=1 Tax=Alteromonas arenosi TaxID=3055817 RepID=A0ABT7SXK6_9ALTE|nr:dTMP kinase [Alteromonas sp. ASW11-36]MDM7860734.1 dTMP kinase [Alteromonas sp. ASW11-36]
MKSGKFIVVEGLEGAGKSSVIAQINTALKDAQKDVVNTREPGGTPMAEAIRACVKQPWDETVTTETELMLMYAARSQLIENVIKPAIEQGQWVVGDRHDLSSIAYQGGGRGVDRTLLDTIRGITLQGFKPDLTIYLDVEPAVGLARARGRGELDRIELSGLDFFERARSSYLAEADKDNSIRVVDAMQDMDAVHQCVVSIINQFVQQ